MKLNNFRGELTDISAKKEPLIATLLLDQASDVVWGLHTAASIEKRLNILEVIRYLF